MITDITMITKYTGNIIACVHNKYNFLGLPESCLAVYVRKL